MNRVNLRDNRITLINGDCLEVLPKVRPACVDMVFADLPYGTTACKWDSPIDLDLLWYYLCGKEIESRPTITGCCKGDAAIVCTATQPFTTTLNASNLENLKYELIWDKGRGNEPQLANVRPMKAHESISIFCRAKTRYYPQMRPLAKPDKRSARGDRINRADGTGQNILSGSTNDTDTVYVARYPISILPFENGNQRKKDHPTQKPVELLEYLIKTYTNENDVVLDPTAGSFTTAVACINTNRRCIAIEKDTDYFQIGVKRCEDAINARQ